MHWTHIGSTLSLLVMDHELFLLETAHTALLVMPVISGEAEVLIQKEIDSVLCSEHLQGLYSSLASRFKEEFFAWPSGSSLKLKHKTGSGSRIPVRLWPLLFSPR